LKNEPPRQQERNEVRLKETLSRIVRQVIRKYNSFEEPERRRLLVLGFSLLFFLDYIMFCHHSDNGILAIFPSIPSLEESHKVNIYLPTFNDMSIEKEIRKIPVFEDRKRETMHLFCEVVRGSKFENTSLFVPVEIRVREIWFLHEKIGSDKGDHCIIDVDPGFYDGKASAIPGSEELFRKAVEKTLKENIPKVVKVTIIERGIPDTRIWDYASGGAENQ